MNDASDLRTRAIYASLQDDDLVRQLQEAQRARHTQPTPALPTGSVAGSVASSGTAVTSRPWPVPAAREVIDLTGAQTHAPTGVAAGAPRPSEWSIDDPSYYLG